MLSSKSACMFLLFLRRIKNQINATIAASPTTPPTTPPAIAPVSKSIDQRLKNPERTDDHCGTPSAGGA